jgi:hypothetical protein
MYRFWSSVIDYYDRVITEMETILDALLLPYTNNSTNGGDDASKAAIDSLYVTMTNEIQLINSMNASFMTKVAAPMQDLITKFVAFGNKYLNENYQDKVMR